MFKKIKEERINKKIFGVFANFYIRENGEYIACPCGKSYDLNNYRYGNMNKINDRALYNLVIEMLNESLNRENYESVDNCGKKADKIHEWEREDYSKDKCQSVKWMTIQNNDVYPNSLVIVDNVCLGRYYWGGGKYMHLLSLDVSEKELASKIREIYSFRNGHLSGTSEEEMKKQRVASKK